MKRWAGLLRCAFVCAILLAANKVLVGQTGAGGGNSGATVVTEQTHGEVSLKVGGVLEVRLKSNFTKGYMWITAPVANPVLMTQGKVPYEELVAGDNVGAGGVEVWRFKAVKAGRQALQFKFCGPSEKGAPAAKIVTFSVTVE
jgi:inhibitor of cysteine peptidase